MGSSEAPRASEVPASDRLFAELKPRQGRIDEALGLWLSRVTAGAPAAVHEATAYSLFAPGKRLRPLLVALACEAVGGTLELALPSACAVEMIHTYSLIHDDLPAMDDDDLRRGQPTCHKKFGEALAILAGDALLTGAFQVLAEGYPPRTAAVSCLELAKGAGAVGMVGGQVLDLQAEGKIGGTKDNPTPQPPPPEGEGEKKGDHTLAPPSFLGKGAGGLGLLEDVHARKTGALFRSSLRLGVFAAQAERPAGPAPEALAAADAYAGAFGLLFQVTDDLLDVESTADKAGKRVGKDAARGKLTYPGLLGVEESRRKATELGLQAVAAAERLGSPPLADLARYVVQRDR
ncbi:MAG: polyprenyl synthetase family protein [Planctomycetes bacterium]|nr:polyprenyl synthetase family protein [Planctomycetota bacterium]